MPRTAARAGARAAAQRLHGRRRTNDLAPRWGRSLTGVRLYRGGEVVGSVIGEVEQGADGHLMAVPARPLGEVEGGVADQVGVGVAGQRGEFGVDDGGGAAPGDLLDGGRPEVHR